MGFQLSIVTPARPLVDAEVDSMVAPGREGDFGVLPGHEQFLAPLRPGRLRYSAGGQEAELVVAGGFAEVTPEGVSVLAPRAASRDEIDRAEARRQLDAAETAFSELSLLAPAAEQEAARERVEVARAWLAMAGT